MEFRVLQLGFFLLLIGRLTYAEKLLANVCPVISITDSILGFQDVCMDSRGYYQGLIEGDDVTLQRALNLAYKDSHEYVSVLFYASWCPFSRSCRPTFAHLSSLYPSIRHFAVEESLVKPSVLSRYGVHGFPTLFLLNANSSLRVRYHGSRSLTSLVSFYRDVTGLRPLLLNQSSLDTMGNPLNLAKNDYTEPENCPFSWAKSPENMLREETYLALATTFVLLRYMYILLPMVIAFARGGWRRHVRNLSLMSLWEHPLAHLRRAMQVFGALKERCKRSNLQEGAMNARAWASKSLASVSIGDASSSRESH
ncbi:5'-adenylylsulfate reductase-like [Ranunculus cassubicifolius]